MLIQNGLVFTPSCRFILLDVEIADGVIQRLAPSGSIKSDDVLDATGMYVLPGFIDIHSHGAVGYDLCDADTQGLQLMLEYYAKHGVTSVIPATMSYSQTILEDIIKAALPLFDQEGYGAVLRGINMEGPFLNPEKCGAQNPDYIITPDVAMFDTLYELAKGYIKLVDIAPEMHGSEDFIRHVRERCVVSLAHTAANYEQAAAAFQAGARHVTHMFNAMPSFGHREPGVIGAASDYAAFVELISDGIHVHPAAVRALFQWFGAERICLISDSMRGTGLPDGEYDLGGQVVHLEKGKATLSRTDTIAGSAANLMDCVRRAITFGVPMEQVICSASQSPARAVGLDDKLGSLAPGKRADIILWDASYNIHQVLVGGKSVL